VARSPNYGDRRGAARPVLVVLHYTAMADCDAARDWLCTPDSQVSAHYLVSEAGAVDALVPEDKRAWHAGAGAWGAITDVNSHSIGIELANPGTAPFAAAQMDALEGLLGGIMARWSIPPEGVIGHSDCAPGRKIDPGPRFDWARLVRSGLAGAPARAGAPAPVDGGGFRRDLRRIGYTAPAGDAALLAAFRLRHRAGHDGPLDGVDCALAAELARRFDVDRGPDSA
jgi:N-acetylmuramoyl-L-alanine amidase